MNPLEFVIAIIAITTIGGIIKAKHGARRGRRSGRSGFRADMRDDDDEFLDDSAETMRLREEVKMLKQRLQVLERIAVDKENTLSNEIERLRDR